MWKKPSIFRRSFVIRTRTFTTLKEEKRAMISRATIIAQLLYYCIMHLEIKQLDEKETLR